MSEHPNHFSQVTCEETSLVAEYCIIPMCMLDDDRISHGTIRDYVAELKAAGYIEVVRQGLGQTALINIKQLPRTRGGE